MIRLLVKAGRRLVAEESSLHRGIDASDTVSLLLQESHAALDREFESIRALDRKAATLFEAASIVVSLMAVTASLVVQSGEAEHVLVTHVRCAIAFGALLYLGVLFCTVNAFRLRTYYLPLRTEREEILKDYLPLPVDEARKQLLANYIEQCTHNSNVREQKAKWVRRSLYVMAINTGYLAVLLIIVLLVV
jgi:hypothetical protein